MKKECEVVRSIPNARKIFGMYSPAVKLFRIPGEQRIKRAAEPIVTADVEQSNVKYQVFRVFIVT